MCMRVLSKGAIAALLFVVTALTGSAAAQEQSRAAVELSGGVVGFADDATVWEAFAGGGARFYVSPRVSIGPELTYIQGERHNHLVLTGNLTYDFLPLERARARRITPFVVVGGGLFRTRSTPPGGTFTSSEGAFTAGGGIRALAGDRVTVGIDARIGWELHLRLGAQVGVQLWK